MQGTYDVAPVKRLLLIVSWERLKTSCLYGDSNPDLSPQPGSTGLSGRFNLSVEVSLLNHLAKQAHVWSTLKAG